MIFPMSFSASSSQKRLCCSASQRILLPTCCSNTLSQLHQIKINLYLLKCLIDLDALLWFYYLLLGSLFPLALSFCSSFCKGLWVETFLSVSENFFVLFSLLTDNFPVYGILGSKLHRYFLSAL